MKISPLPSTGVPTVGGAAEASRSFTMRTNATPAQELIQEDPQEEEAKPDEASQPLSPQFAALARERRRLQQERKSFEEERAKARSTTQADMVPKAQLKSDWLRTVLDAGLSWDDLVKSVIDYQSGPNAELSAMRNELKEIREGQDKRWTDYEQQQETQARAEMRREAQQLVSSGDDFEAIKHYGKQGLDYVDDLIYRTWKKDGRLLSPREACQLVEDQLIERAIKQAQLKKVQSKLAPPTPAPTSVPPQQRQMRTLTNRDTASVPLDRRARAIAAAYGQLKR